MIRETWGTSSPRAHTSVEIRTRLKHRGQRKGQFTYTTRSGPFWFGRVVSWSPGSGSELLHDGLSLLLRHVSVHGRHSEVGLPHLLCQPVHLENTHTVSISKMMCGYTAEVGRAWVPWSNTNLSLSVAEDDGLCDGQRVVQVTQGVKLPLLSLHGYEELLDSLQSQLITGETRHQLGKHCQGREGKPFGIKCSEGQLGQKP